MMTEYQLHRKRHNRRMKRLHLGYKPSRFLTVMTQKDIKQLPPPTNRAPQEIAKLQKFVGKAVSFVRRMFGR